MPPVFRCREQHGLMPPFGNPSVHKRDLSGARELFMINVYRSIFVLTLLLIASGAVPAEPPGSTLSKPRVVITADPELDDNNTLIRAILYSSELRIEGLVYASSGVHWKSDGKGTTQYIPGREYTRLGLGPVTSWRWPEDDHFIDEIVDAYAKAYPNLKVHDRDYPAPADLKSKIKWGNVEFEADYSKDTDGSNLIKSLLLDDQPGPLYVTAQGGQSTIARALKSIYDQYASTPQWETIRDKVSLKLVIIPFGDQDGTYARYIRPNWPEVTEWQLAMINYGYGIRNGLTPENQVYISPAWTKDNILSRGPLGAMYRVWGDGKQMAKGDRNGLLRVVRIDGRSTPGDGLHGLDTSSGEGVVYQRG